RLQRNRATKLITAIPAKETGHNGLRYPTTAKQSEQCSNQNLQRMKLEGQNGAPITGDTG
ncbi:hypothetical protein A2U01_0029205, partial [Trifolium medium]|nr:hypothetical protein [Trifolium medium]